MAFVLPLAPLLAGEGILAVAGAAAVATGAAFIAEEHTKNKRRSTKAKHEKGEARRRRDQQRKQERKKGKKGSGQCCGHNPCYCESEGEDDLLCINKGPSGSGMTEVHILGADSNYQDFTLQSATALHYTSGAGAEWDFAVKGNADLLCINKGPSGSGMTEVHILSAASKYTEFTLHAATACHYTSGAGAEWAFAAKGNGDLLCINKGPSESGMTEVHILSPASNYTEFALHTVTACHYTSGAGAEWDFAVKVNGDLLCINKGPSGSGMTEVHILSAASKYTEFTLHTATACHYTSGAGAEWAFATKGNDDLLCINKGPSGSGMTEVHILSAASNYKEFVVHTVTACHYTSGVGAEWECKL